MGTTDTYTKVIEIVSEAIDIDVEELSEDTKFAELDADSFDMLEIVTSIENEFGIDVSDTDIEDIRTIGDVVELLDED